MKISEINIVPTKPKDGLLGFASFVIDHDLYIGNVAIFSRLDRSGIRLVYPKKKDIHCVCPINKEAGETITNAIESQYYSLFPMS